MFSRILHFYCNDRFWKQQKYFISIALHPANGNFLWYAGDATVLGRYPGRPALLPWDQGAAHGCGPDPTGGLDRTKLWVRCGPYFYFVTTGRPAFPPWDQEAAHSHGPAGGLACTHQIFIPPWTILLWSNFVLTSSFPAWQIRGKTWSTICLKFLTWYGEIYFVSFPSFLTKYTLTKWKNLW